MNVLSKCCRYCETDIKLLCTLEAGTELDKKTLDDLFLIQHAQIKCLQEEFAALLVGGQFDSRTAKKNSGPCRKTRLVLTRIRSKPFEQRQRCRRRVVPRLELQGIVARTDEAFPDPGVDVTVTDSVVLSTAGRRTFSSPLRIDSS
ncbi:hypothetical protein DPMN_170496 [Dreissena polymorpha]|uniref:Uncharacterized protein n=1 Tax=Dreissena polymorpha TaxID=45954 RepID=A0A9D4DZW5_DREPO|nr:hypothetical protein DPMN_170496 [Dreissena polymorpha]